MGLGQAIEACLERLPDHPFLYRPGRAPGTREALVHPNDILVYRVTGEAVVAPARTSANGACA